MTIVIWKDLYVKFNNLSFTYSKITNLLKHKFTFIVKALATLGFIIPSDKLLSTHTKKKKLAVPK